MTPPRAPSARRLVALDQGGHASRALVFDELGRVLGRGMCEVRERRPGPGRVEQDPDELVASLRAAAVEALASLGPAPPGTRAGLATQRSSIVCWDRETGAALSPVLSWQDRRAHRWLEGLGPRAGEIHRKTGLRLTAHYGGSKLRWCLDRLEPVRAARRRGTLACGPLAAFLAHRLLDERPLAVDPANAARTLLFNLHDLDWDPELLEWFGVPPEVLPGCVATRHGFGTLTVGGTSLPLTVLTGDQSAALFAHGSPRADTAYLNLGTGAFVQRAVASEPPPVPGLLTGVVLRDGDEVTWVLEGTVNGAGSALARTARELGIDAYEDQLCSWLERAEDPPLFLNGVSGLGSPWWIADFPSRFVGGGGPREKMVAVAESIVFLVCVNVEALAGAGAPFARILATGGLAWNDALCRRLADLSGLPVDRPEEFEATARGTAYLLAGRPDRWPDAAPATRFEPRERPGLRRRFESWRRELQRRIHAPPSRGADAPT